MTLGEQIKALRQARGWTREQLAERAGMTGAYLSMLESGKRSNPTRDALRRLAAALGTSVADLEAATEAPEQDDPFPAANLREWGISEEEITFYATLWPAMDRAERVKFLGNLQMSMHANTAVRTLIEQVRAKIQALQRQKEEDDDVTDKSQTVAPQIAV